MLRLATLIPKGPEQYSLGWKQSGRGAVDAKRPEEGTPAFAEMADPGTSFEGTWRENEFLNRDEVRQVLRWNAPVTRERLFEAANLYAEKQLELHAQYAGWTGLAGLACVHRGIAGEARGSAKRRRMPAGHRLGRGFSE